MAFLKSTSRKEKNSVLFGERLTLKRPSMGDYQQWAALREMSASFLRPFEPSWTSDELTKQSFRKRMDFYKRCQREGSAFAFFLRLNENEQLLGGITLSNIRHGVISSGAIGYWIGEQYAKRGYMSEAVEIMIPFAFETLNLHRLEAACMTTNNSSIALLKKNGFQKEGVARKYLKINGDWKDHLLFALLNEDCEPGGHCLAGI